MLSALQKRLLVCRGFSRARARAGSPVTIRPPSTRAKPGSIASTPASFGDGQTGIVDLDGDGAHAARASDVDGERDGGVGLQLFRRDEHSSAASSDGAVALRRPSRAARRAVSRAAACCGRRARRRRACRRRLPAAGGACCANDAASHAASATAGTANLNQRIAESHHGLRMSIALIADCARFEIPNPRARRSRSRARPRAGPPPSRCASSRRARRATAPLAGPSGSSTRCVDSIRSSV